MNGSGAGGTALVVVIFLLALYFMPTAIAAARRHRQALAIGAVNFFFGWTAIGWIVSLIWALTNPAGSSPTIVVNASATNTAAPPPLPAYPSQDRRPVFRAEPPSLPPPAGRVETVDADTRFWDGLDKTDPDLLEEYLIRFPDGRFAALARRKLERQGHAAAPAQSVTARAALPSPAPFCTGCGARQEEGSTFCTACGAILA